MESEYVCINENRNQDGVNDQEQSVNSRFDVESGGFRWWSDAIDQLIHDETKNNVGENWSYQHHILYGLLNINIFQVIAAGSFGRLVCVWINQMSVAITSDDGGVSGRADCRGTVGSQVNTVTIVWMGRDVYSADSDNSGAYGKEDNDDKKGKNDAY